MLILKARLTSVQKLKTQLNLTFAVREFAEDDDLRMTQDIDTDGFLVFDSKPIKREIEEAMKDREIAVETGKRSPSQILRGALFKYWNDRYEGTEKFEEFYKRSMDKFIHRVNTSLK